MHLDCEIRGDYFILHYLVSLSLSHSSAGDCIWAKGSPLRIELFHIGTHSSHRCSWRVHHHNHKWVFIVSRCFQDKLVRARVHKEFDRFLRLIIDLLSCSHDFKKTINKSEVSPKMYRLKVLICYSELY